MPKPKQPTGPRKALSVWLSIIAVVSAGLLVHLWFKAAPEVEPVATVPVAPSPPQIATRHIYSETADPKADIAAALAQAKREHKRVIVDFGGDWCGDCQVLDIYLHQEPNDELLAKKFVLVHVWVGQIDTNLDIADKYGVAVHKGVPALAVLAPNGRVIFAQKSGEFEKMRQMESSSVTEFLDKWKS